MSLRWAFLSVLLVAVGCTSGSDNTEFVLDSAPQNTRFASVEFDVVVSGITRRYQITGTLRCYSGS